MRYVRLSEVSEYIDTTEASIKVTVCSYKKKNGVLPCWYKVEGNQGQKKAYIDIDYLLAIRNKEVSAYHASCGLFYFITENMGIKQSELAPILASSSELYNKQTSWMSFMQTDLFHSPRIRFYERVTRLQEFNRICEKMKEDYDNDRCKNTITI